MPFWRSVVNAARQHGFGSAREFSSGTGFRAPMHGFEHLKQAPTVALITLAVQDTFSLEIHIIDKRIAPLWCFCQTFKLLLHVSSIGGRRFGQHFRQSGFQSGNKKFRLQIDCIDQETAQLIHLSRILRPNKLGARVPWTSKSTAGAQKKSWQFGAAV